MFGLSFRRGFAAAIGGISVILLVTGSAVAQNHIMKLGHPLPPPAPLHKWAVFFKDGVEKRAQGRLEVKIFPLSTLGKIPRMIEGTQLGTIEAVTIPPGFFTGIDQRYSVLAAPGIFDDIEHGHRTVHDPEFKKVFWPIGEQKGLKMMGMSCDAPTAYATVKPIRKIADFKGKKLRVFGSKLEIETLRRVGAHGIPMALSEVIPAIQRKVIDGNKAAIVVFVPFKYQSVAKYVLRAKASIICIVRFASKVWFDKLPGDLQQIILDEAAIADDKIISVSVRMINKMYGIWEKTGGELNVLSDAEQIELRRRLSTVGDDVLKDQPEVLKVYNVMKSVADRTRNR